MKLHRFSSHNQAGFTIIELLIATTVFAALLLTLMFGVVEISRIYYRGITQTNTQNTARNIMSSISQAIQFDGSFSTGAGNGSSLAFCAGNTQYTYLLGYQLENTNSAPNTQNNHVLVSNTISSPSCPQAQHIGPPGGSASGTELMANNMRIASLNITPLSHPGVYSVEIRIVYGADDLLCNPSIGPPGLCSSSATMPAPADYVGQNVNCKGGSGSEFCDVSDLSTIVQSRVN